MSSPHKNAIHLVFKKLQNTYNKWCHGVLHKRLRPNIHNESLKVAHCKRKEKKKHETSICMPQFTNRSNNKYWVVHAI
jgi:hypothetical protein